MTAQDVLDRVLAAGAVVASDAEGPYLDNVPADLRPLVEERRHELRRLIQRPAAMPSLTAEALDKFAAEGDAVGFRVPWCRTVLWWAPNAIEAAKLLAWGIAERGAVWTADELTSLVGLVGPAARAVVAAKLAVDGYVTESPPR